MEPMYERWEPLDVSVKCGRRSWKTDWKDRVNGMDGTESLHTIVRSEFAENATDGLIESSDQFPRSNAMVSVHFSNKDGVVVAVTETIQFAGIEGRRCTHRRKLSTQVVQFSFSFAFFVTCDVSPMENLT
jgi:hypothetical protein